MSAKLKRVIAKEKDIVRRDHLQRQLDGPAAIEHLTIKDTSKRDKHLKLVDDVATVGTKNKMRAIALGKRAAEKAAKAQEAEAKALADKATKAAEEAKSAVEEFDQISALKDEVARLEAENKQLREGK